MARNYGRTLDEKELSWVELQRLEGWSWRNIADRLGMGRDQLRNQADPERRDYLRFRTHCRPEPRVTPTKAAQADRDRRYLLEPASVTAALLGDPLPGYSAWDQKNASRQ